MVGQGPSTGQVGFVCVYSFHHREQEHPSCFVDCCHVTFGLYPVTVFASRVKRIETRQPEFGHHARSDSTDIAAMQGRSKIAGSRSAPHLHQVPHIETASLRAVVPEEDSARPILDEGNTVVLAEGHYGLKLHGQRPRGFNYRQCVNLPYAREYPLRGGRIGTGGHSPFQYGGAGARPHREAGDLFVVGFREHPFLQGYAQFAGGVPEPLLSAGGLGEDASAQPDPPARQ